MRLTLLLGPLSWCCSCFVCTYCLVPTAFPESLQGVGAVSSLWCKHRALLASSLQLPSCPAAVPCPANHSRGRCLFSGARWLLLRGQSYTFWDAFPSSSSPLFCLPAHFYVAFCPTLAATRRHGLKPTDIMNCWQANGGLFSVIALSRISWQAKQFVCCCSV